MRERNLLHGERTRGNYLKLKKERFRLDVRGKSLYSEGREALKWIPQRSC